MKKIIMFSFAVSLASLSFSQNQNANPSAVWNLNGNTINSSASLGTNNSSDMLFKTNNLIRGRLSAQGHLLIEGGGKMGINLPLSAGLIPQFMLEVNGDGKFTGPLNVERHLFVQDYIETPGDIKGNHGTFSGNLTVAKDFSVNGSSSFTGDVLMSGKLDVMGDATFQNKLTAQKGLMFDNSIGIRYTPASGNASSSVSFGKGNLLPFATGCNISPVNTVKWNWDGFVQVYDGGNIATTNVLQFAATTAASSIESSTADGISGAPLLLNYFCHGDVNINTNFDGSQAAGTTGGVVNIGQNMQIGLPYPFDTGTALNIKAWGNTGINLMDKNNLVTYRITDAGQTSIFYHGASPGTFDAFTVNDASTGKVNFKVKANGRAWARRMEVTVNNFPDYVFAKEYKSLSISELKLFIEKNKKLPQYPSAKEVEKDGLDLGETARLNVESIEQLSLYIISMNERLDNQEKENAELKKKVAELEAKQK